MLGDVEAEVVHSAFGYFNFGLASKIWNSAKEVMPAREAGALYMECAGAFGASKLVDIDGFDAVNAASDKVIAAGLANCAG